MNILMRHQHGALDKDSINLVTSREARVLLNTFEDLSTTKGFAFNSFFGKEDQKVIMDYAQAYTIMEQNPVARGICLTNMGILRF